MADIPMTMGLETEYAITSTHDQDVWAHCEMPYRVVRAVELLDTRLVNRGLEQVEDIDEHERAEADSIKKDFFLEADTARRWQHISESAALRQRFAYSGYVLPTGARLYVDMGHPEYSTPETQDPRTVVLAQKAGDWIVDQCRAHAENMGRRISDDPDFAIHIYRNNCDTQGHSWAAHENYMISPHLFNPIMGMEYGGRYGFYRRPNAITHAVLKFFATRQIITGAGRIGLGEYFSSAGYQISQRADFLVRPIGQSTVENRGIINTRDHPLARYGTFCRLHVICGDSNMSELSIYLKCGITALFLKMLEYDYIQAASGDLMTPLVDSVASLHAVSRDLTLRERLLLLNGEYTSALETQMQFCERAKSFVDQMDLGPVWRDVVVKWEAVLNGLNTNRFTDTFARSLDWVIKEYLFKQLQKRNRPIETLMDFDLDYHDINRSESQYDRLMGGGLIMRLVSDEEIMRMTQEPAADSRAWLRGILVKRYAEHLIDIGWDYACFKDGLFLVMDNPYGGTREQVEPLLADDPSFDDLMRRIQSLVRWQRVSIPPALRERRLAPKRQGNLLSLQDLNLL